MSSDLERLVVSAAAASEAPDATEFLEGLAGGRDELRGAGHADEAIAARIREREREWDAEANPSNKAAVGLTNAKSETAAHTSSVDTTPKNTGNDEVLSAVGAVGAPPVFASYIPFPVEVLPQVVRNYVSAAAAAIGCDPAFIALPLLASLARAIGNRRVVCLKSTWVEPAVLWLAIVGKSGTHKSPAIQAGTGFLQTLENQAYADFETAQADYQERRLIYEQELAAWEKPQAGLTTPPPLPPEEPTCHRYITSDITIEALACLLASQFDGALVVRDELAGWLGGIAEYKGGKGSDLGHWLASWSAVPMTVDRKTGPQKILRIPKAAVSIVGGVQPAVLRQAIGREHRQDGLCARMLFAMPDPRPVRWSEATVSHKIEAAMKSVIEGLLALPPAVDENNHPIPQAIPLSSRAKVAWVEYFNRHRAELPGLADDLAAAWSKLEAYTARFALIFQLCSVVADELIASEDKIDEAAMQSAIQLSDWFGGEARRVYGMFTESEADREDRELAAQIRRRGGTLSARELMRSSHRYPSATAAEAALNRLARRNWGRWQNVPAGPKGGQPTRTLQLVDSADTDTTSQNTGIREVVSTGILERAEHEPTHQEETRRHNLGKHGKS